MSFIDNIFSNPIGGIVTEFTRLDEERGKHTQKRTQEKSKTPQKNYERVIEITI